MVVLLMVSLGGQLHTLLRRGTSSMVVDRASWLVIRCSGRAAWRGVE
jgi:hypothetical protein